MTGDPTNVGAGVKKPLRYLFVPLPLWAQEAFEAGELSTEARDLQLVLFKRANREALANRGETPEIRIKSLAKALGREIDPASLESLKRLLRSYRAEGLLGFRTRGTGRATIYVFTLLPDGRRRSATVPPSPERPVPGFDGAGMRAASGTTGVRADTRSAPVTTAAQEAVPAESPRVPPFAMVANPGYERDCGESGSSAVPDASEVLDKTQTKQSSPRVEGPLLVKGPARTREEEIREDVQRALEEHTDHPNRWNLEYALNDLARTHDVAPAPSPDQGTNARVSHESR